MNEYFTKFMQNLYIEMRVTDALIYHCKYDEEIDFYSSIKGEKDVYLEDYIGNTITRTSDSLEIYSNHKLIRNMILSMIIELVGDCRNIDITVYNDQLYLASIYEESSNFQDQEAISIYKADKNKLYWKRRFDVDLYINGQRLLDSDLEVLFPIEFALMDRNK